MPHKRTVKETLAHLRRVVGKGSMSKTIGREIAEREVWNEREYLGSREPSRLHGDFVATKRF